MSGAVKSVSKAFGLSPPKPSRNQKYLAMLNQQNASRVGGPMTPEQIAEQRAALAAQGRRPKEDELEAGTRPLQGSESASSIWS